MKKLPIGLQDFGELRRGGFLYVDKTQLLYQLATEGKYYFLSRPRRFGKSLLVSTLSELLQGRQELFQELWIHDRWDWTQDLSGDPPEPEQSGLQRNRTRKSPGSSIEKIAARYGITLQSEANSLRLRELIIELHRSFGQAVVLIDEYDKPILDYLEDLDQARAHREQLKSFFSVLKDADPHLRLVLLTGVSKFSRVSIFSELNNLKDLTLHPQYTTFGLRPAPLPS